MFEQKECRVMEGGVEVSWCYFYEFDGNEDGEVKVMKRIKT